jgi:fermentation-respiration switch protein FrsA (DUF1100 family)
VAPSLSPVDWFVFRPLRYPNGDWQPDDLIYEDCFFPTADGTMLHGWWCPTEVSAPTVFYLHGNRGHLASRAWIVKRLQKFFGWNIFIFDYQGYGRSEGSPRMKCFLKDAESAFDYLCQRQQLVPADLLVVGRSLGGAVATHIAIQNQTKALILECTFTSLLDAASVSWPRWLVRPVIMGRLNTLSVINQFSGTLIIGHGEEDELIPFEHGQRLFEKASDPKYFFPFPEQGHKKHPPDWFWQEVGQILNSHEF